MRSLLSSLADDVSTQQVMTSAGVPTLRRSASFSASTPQRHEGTCGCLVYRYPFFQFPSSAVNLFLSVDDIEIWTKITNKRTSGTISHLPLLFARARGFPTYRKFRSLHLSFSCFSISVIVLLNFLCSWRLKNRVLR